MGIESSYKQDLKFFKPQIGSNVGRHWRLFYKKKIHNNNFPRNFFIAIHTVFLFLIEIHIEKTYNTVDLQLKRKVCKIYVYNILNFGRFRYEEKKQ